MKTMLTKAAICAAVSGLLCTVAIAQKIPEIEVHAHRGVTTQLVGRDKAGIPVTEATMTLGVSLADLDLSTSAGKGEAKKRIFSAAGEACMDIVREFPEEVHTLQKCTGETARAAENDLERRVAALESPGANR